MIEYKLFKISHAQNLSLAEQERLAREAAQADKKKSSGK